MSEPALPLYVVCDGPRDHAAICRLTSRLIGREIEPECEDWPRLHRSGSGSGYGRKLKYAVRRAIANGRAGIIAAVDRDRHDRRAKLKELRAARDEDRAKAVMLPTALGEAAPHFEAWLIDDPTAVRHALRLDSGVEIPSVKRTKDPKASLNDLISLAMRDRSAPDSEILASIAEHLEPGRCSHAADTGFEEFVDDVRAELGPLADSASTA